MTLVEIEKIKNTIHMARAASAVPHQPDSTNPTHPPVLTSPPPLCLFLLYYLITLCIHLSTAQRLHSLRHPTGRLRPFRRYTNTTWHCLISSPVRSHPVPHVNQGRASRPKVDERAARFTRWCAPPAQRCSTSLFLHAGASRIARLIVFRLQASTAFSCLINVWLIVFFYYRPLPIQVCFDFTDTY